MTMMTDDFSTRTACGGTTRRKPGFWQRLFAGYQLVSQRQALSRLDDHLLKDIGVSREEAGKEAKRPVWDAPDRWLR